eukprot:768799-Hanusia_phi.AAC.11
MISEYEQDMRLVLERLQASEQDEGKQGRILQLAEELLQVPSNVRGFGHVRDKAWKNAIERLALLHSHLGANASADGSICSTAWRVRERHSSLLSALSLLSSLGVFP